jgi:ABC-type transport system involved in cytochrome c biogenesis ATPase subunit
MPAIVLQAQDLGYAHPQRRLFHQLSFELAPGLSLVRGGDGSGKTTLLRLLAGDLPSVGGALWLKGVSLSEQPAAYRAQVFRVHHHTAGLDQITPHDYLDSLQARHPGFEPARLPALIDGLGLAPHWHKPMYMLSTGSRRKVGLAAAFAAGAALTLVDEPFAALDRPSINFVLALLQQVAADTARAWVVADYQAPPGLTLATVLDLPDSPAA